MLATVCPPSSLSNAKTARRRKLIGCERERAAEDDREAFVVGRSQRAASTRAAAAIRRASTTGRDCSTLLPDRDVLAALARERLARASRSTARAASCPPARPSGRAPTARRSGTASRAAASGRRRARSGARRAPGSRRRTRRCPSASRSRRRRGTSRRRQRRRPGTPTSITKRPPGSRCRATLRKHATWPSCVVRLLIVLKTR